MFLPADGEVLPAEGRIGLPWSAGRGHFLLLGMADCHSGAHTVLLSTRGQHSIFRTTFPPLETDVHFV
jgi:hypothetical protein